MFLNLNHQKLNIYSISRAFVCECYKLTSSFPREEKFSLINQIRKAAISVHLNIAEGCSRRSEFERKRFFEIARGSIIEIDAALDIAFDLHYFKQTNDQFVSSMVNCFKLLTGLMKANRE